MALLVHVHFRRKYSERINRHEADIRTMTSEGITDESMGAAVNHSRMCGQAKADRTSNNYALLGICMSISLLSIVVVAYNAVDDIVLSPNEWLFLMIRVHA